MSVFRRLIFTLFVTVAVGRAADYPAGVFVEAEHFEPVGDGWSVVMMGQGNYMVDIIGFQHISGERLLSAKSDVKDARATATIQIPEDGDYRLWTRYETPTNCEQRFRVEIRQSDKVAVSVLMGERDAPKYWFGGKKPVGQYDASWGSEGLAAQVADAKGLRAGPAQITLISVAQPEPAANRNVDFVYMTRDLQDTHRQKTRTSLYPILEATLRDIPPRYFLRMTSPRAERVNLSFTYNRLPWGVAEGVVDLAANQPSEWIPLKEQDVCHFTTLNITGSQKSLSLRVELAGGADGKPLFRTIDWNDPLANRLLIGLPAYPGRYDDEQVMTVEEQYIQIAEALRSRPTIGRAPTEPLNWGGHMQIWQHGRVPDAAANLYHAIGMRLFGGFMQPPKLPMPALEVARERFAAWNLKPGRTIALGQYRFFPTPENIAATKQAAADAGVADLVHRFDYGDEIAFNEWLSLLKPEELTARWEQWQKARHGEIRHAKPDSRAATATADPTLFVDSMIFYEDTAIERVAELAAEIPKQLGPEVYYGANVGCHPFYYPEIAKYVKWFRAGAANFGRHSEYFWQIGQPGPMINSYIADHFRCGMRDLPRSLHLQYTMPHSPGNSDASFRRTAFGHLAHGARGLDYFGIGINSTFTENYIDFRDIDRYAAIRDVNYAVGLVEDILPESRVVPSKVALILSDSTERWDFSGLAKDKASLNVFGAGYKKLRNCYHLDRVGIYYALVNESRPPDLLIEEDLVNGWLDKFEVAYWVGDCIEPKAFEPIAEWVRGGGHLVATAGAFRLDSYRRSLPAGAEFLGLTSATLDERETFFRPQLELPYLQPLDHVGDMPVFGVIDRVNAAESAEVVSRFANGGPAVIQRKLGKGRITYIAALPGVTYLYSAHLPPQPPPRGIWSHQLLVNFNADAGRLITDPVRDVATSVEVDGGRLDARLLKSPNGYAIPLANYSPDTDAELTLTLRGLPPIKRVVSAVRGELLMEKTAGGGIVVRYAPGIGDMLRVEPE